MLYDNEILLTGPQVAHWVGVHLATIYRWAQAGTFPQSVRVGANVVRWRTSEVNAWMANLPANQAHAA